MGLAGKSGQQSSSPLSQMCKEAAGVNRKRIEQGSVTSVGGGSALSIYGGLPGSRDHNASGGGLVEDSFVLPGVVQIGQLLPAHSSAAALFRAVIMLQGGE